MKESTLQKKNKKQSTAVYDGDAHGKSLIRLLIAHNLQMNFHGVKDFVIHLELYYSGVARNPGKLAT